MGQEHPQGMSVTFREYFETMRKRPVYVVLGVQGSGTNLLSRILVRTFAFSVLRDRSMVFNAAVRLGTHPSRAHVQREIARFQRLLTPSFLDRLGGKKSIRQHQPFAGIFRELTPDAVRSGSDFALLIYAYRAFSLGLREMAIKSDDIWQGLDAIDEIIPNRRIIFLTRDFRDNLLSVAGKSFGPIEPVCAARYVKQRAVRYAAEYQRARSSGYHVKFETLVSAPRQFVDDFCRHFGLSPATDPQIALNKIPIRRNKTEKWRRMRSQELAWCEAILENELLTFGYPLASARRNLPPVGTLMKVYARDSIKRIPQKIRRAIDRMRSQS